MAPASTSKAKSKPTIIDLNKALASHDVRYSNVGDRASKEKLLGTISERDTKYPFNVNFNVGNLEAELKEKRKIFGEIHPKTGIVTEPEEYLSLWKSIDNLKYKDIPDCFNIEVITKFLGDPKVTINEKPIEAALKPVVKGRNMYHSRRIITCEYIITNEKILVIKSLMDSSYGKER